jgi:TfoX/Sxy family transcriptional regulator of competence genes
VAFDEHLAERVRKQLGQRSGLVEKRMFGGLAFLINGNMSVGVHTNELIVRIARDETDASLDERGVRAFDITGRPMKGWLLVASSALKDDASLAKWVRRGVDYASSLPKK